MNNSNRKVVFTFIFLLFYHLHSSVWAASYTGQFPYTKINPDLPRNIAVDLHRIINYRFGTLPQSNMLTIEVRSYVKPGKVYRFETGSLKPVSNPSRLVTIAKDVKQPKYSAINGKWTTKYAKARKEANVLGEYGTLFIEQFDLNFSLEEPTAEKLAYYNSILLKSGDELAIEAPFALPVNVVRFEKNYVKGYLTLPSHGGGYYLETHDTPHLWSHLKEDGRGVVLLGKQAGDDLYHVTAFNIPFGTAIYAPGGVIHCDGLLIGDIMAIYTVTDHYSSVIIKDPDGKIPRLKVSETY